MRTIYRHHHRLHHGPPRCSDEALRGTRVLIVDDNAVARVLLTAMSQARGLRADVAAGGEEALVRVGLADAGDEPYQLLLLDWRMPGMDGVACAQALAERATLRYPALVVIMVTAFGREVARQRLGERQLKVGALLTKPVTPSDLLDACTTALGRKPLTPTRGVRRKVALLDDQTALRGAHVLLVEDNAINQEGSRGRPAEPRRCRRQRRLQRRGGARQVGPRAVRCGVERSSRHSDRS